MHRKPFVLIVLASCMGWLLSYIEVESHPPSRWQKGWASWYGKAFEGRKTASGERFSPGELTAAHRQLPLGTKVMVTEEAPLRQEASAEMFYEVQQVGAFEDPREASTMVDALQHRYPAVYMIGRDGPLGQYYRVRIGPFDEQAQPRRIARELKREGYGLFIDEVPEVALLSQELG